MKVKFRSLLLLSAIFLTACGSGKSPGSIARATPSNPWGYYTGEPETRWNSDGRSMTLLSELRYTDPHGLVWVAPAGSTVDGASIPRSLWSVMGGPFEGKYRNASVLHDAAYDQRNRPWQDCDRMFYNAMRCSGVGAVEAIPRAIPVNENEVNDARDWIRSAQPSLEQIEQRADAEKQ